MSVVPLSVRTGEDLLLHHVPDHDEVRVPVMVHPREPDLGRVDIRDTTGRWLRSAP